MKDNTFSWFLAAVYFVILFIVLKFAFSKIKKQNPRNAGVFIWRGYFFSSAISSSRMTAGL
ncbi:MAG: hypothetical protein IKC76_01600, partial [Firmicutes bacterium]|nr:hypothetical protein [Bacillota bacterium]